MIDIQSRISPINGYKSIYLNQFTYTFCLHDSFSHIRGGRFLRRFRELQIEGGNDRESGQNR